MFPDLGNIFSKLLGVMEMPGLLSDAEFEKLHTRAEFKEYYLNRSAHEMEYELQRIQQIDEEGAIWQLPRAFNQVLALHNRLLELACFEPHLSHRDRAGFVRVVVSMRKQIDGFLIPNMEKMGGNYRETTSAFFKAQEDLIIKNGFYPRAVRQIIECDEEANGIYELSSIAEVMLRS